MGHVHVHVHVMLRVACGACLLKASKSCLTAAGASVARGSPSTYSSRSTHAASASGGNCFTWWMAVRRDQGVAW